MFALHQRRGTCRCDVIKAQDLMIFAALLSFCEELGTFEALKLHQWGKKGQNSSFQERKLQGTKAID